MDKQDMREKIVHEQTERNTTTLSVVKRNRILEDENRNLKEELSEGKLFASISVQHQQMKPNAVLHSAANSVPPVASDYSALDIMRLCGISKATVLRIVTGRYYVGKAVRFRREDIDYYRKTGKRLEVFK